MSVSPPSTTTDSILCASAELQLSREDSAVGHGSGVAANCALFTLLQEWNHHINGATHSRRCQLLLEMYELEVQ